MSFNVPRGSCVPLSWAPLPACRSLPTPGDWKCNRQSDRDSVPTHALAPSELRGHGSPTTRRSAVAECRIERDRA